MMTLVYSQRRQLGFITAGAIAIFFVFRFLPTGTNLSHMDFRVDAKNSIEFCDPLNPQFIPVVAVRSPVTMTIETTPGTAPQAGNPVRAILHLTTSTGKSLSPVDLLETHTRKLHLLIVDPTLTDYQHVHPNPTKRPGEWEFSFTPARSGIYRVFADFTPAATARGLYANADLPVAAQGPVSGLTTGIAITPQSQSSRSEGATSQEPALANEREGVRFTLTPTVSPIRAGQPTDLKFSLARIDGSAVPMEPVMGAFAHLVAFDEARSGFAHLHPMEIDLTQRPDATRPRLNFKVTIPRAGRYVIWAQVNLAGREVFVPFWFQVI